MMLSTSREGLTVGDYEEAKRVLLAACGKVEALMRACLKGEEGVAGERRKGSFDLGDSSI